MDYGIIVARDLRLSSAAPGPKANPLTPSRVVLKPELPSHSNHPLPPSRLGRHIAAIGQNMMSVESNPVETVLSRAVEDGGVPGGA